MVRRKSKEAELPGVIVTEEYSKRSPLPKTIELNVIVGGFRDRISVDSITFLVLTRYTDELKVRNPEVIVSRYTVVHSNRWVCGETDERMFNRLVQHLGVPVHYKWIDLSSRTSYSFPFPGVPTPEQMKAYLDGYDFYYPPKPVVESEDETDV